MMTLSDLAAELGCNPSTLRRQALRRGWTRDGRDWLFSAEQVRLLRAAIMPRESSRVRPPDKSSDRRGT